MNLIISAEFTAPPSEVSVFRTLTMYATLFRSMDCLVEANKHEIDYYYKWLRDKYAKDYIKQMICIGEETGIFIKYNVRYDRLTLNNLNNFISLIE
jgi:pantothenate kinase-related protein Tda10